MKALAAHLKRNRLTQVEFGRLVGVSQSVISDLIRGVHSPSLDLLRRISKVTGLSLDELASSKAA